MRRAMGLAYWLGQVKRQLPVPSPYLFGHFFLLLLLDLCRLVFCVYVGQARGGRGNQAGPGVGATGAVTLTSRLGVDLWRGRRAEQKNFFPFHLPFSFSPFLHGTRLLEAVSEGLPGWLPQKC